MQGPHKKSGFRSKAARCTVIGGGVNELRPELFSDRIDITPGADGVGLHVVATSTVGGLSPIVRSLDHATMTCVLNWNRPLTHVRVTGTDAGQWLDLTMHHGVFNPCGLLGWGHVKVTDPFDGNGDPVRMLSHLSRSLRHLGIRDTHAELAKAAMASVAHGAGSSRITIATDGVGVLVEVNLDGSAGLRAAATRLAAWMDRALTTGRETCAAWVRRGPDGNVIAGVIFAAGHVPVVLVIDETDPAIERGGQTSYNVA